MTSAFIIKIITFIRFGQVYGTHKHTHRVRLQTARRVRRILLFLRLHLLEFPMKYATHKSNSVHFYDLNTRSTPCGNASLGGIIYLSTIFLWSGLLCVRVFAARSEHGSELILSTAGEIYTCAHRTSSVLCDMKTALVVEVVVAELVVVLRCFKITTSYVLEYALAFHCTQSLRRPRSTSESFRRTNVSVFCDA